MDKYSKINLPDGDCTACGACKAICSHNAIGLIDLQKHIKITGIFKDAQLLNQLIDINQVLPDYEELSEHLQDSVQAIRNAETDYRLRLQMVIKEMFYL